MTATKDVVNDGDGQREEEARLQSWGKLLRSAREARNLTVKEVAGLLRLDSRLIEAIEAENGDELPLASFTKGYLRGYARLMELDADAIINAFEQSGHADNSQPRIAEVKRAQRDTDSQDRWPKLATWFVVGAVVISFFVWWSGELLDPKLEDVSFEAVGQAVLNVAEPEPEQGSAGVEQVDEKAAAADEPEVDLLPPVESEAPVAPVAVTPATEVVVNEADLVEVSLTFIEESWVEIYDVNDTRMFLDLGKPGLTKTMKGVPPIRFLIGNSSAVQMSYKGEVYDHMQHDRKGIARFTLE